MLNGYQDLFKKLVIIEKKLNFQDQELLDQAEEKIKKNSSNIVPADKADNFISNANEFWNKFYSIHGNQLTFIVRISIKKQFFFF